MIILLLQSNSLTSTIVSQKYQDLLQPNSRDRFSKISRTFYASRKLWIIVAFLLRMPEEKLAIFLINTLLLHIPLLALTDRQNYRGTNPYRQTELQRNEYTRYAWAGGTFFPVVLLCQFSVLAGNRYWFYILLMYLEYQTVVVLCLFFLIWWEIVLGTHVLSVQYSCV